VSSSEKPDQLKLIALDEEDLAVISAQLQDAVVRVGELAYLKGERRFATVVNRFNWMAALQAGKTGPADDSFERRQTALRFEGVSAAQLQNIDLADKRRVLSLLAIQFAKASEDDPGGHITLVFSGGSGIRLTVDYIECELRDLGAAWSTKSQPKHGDET
jgi:hypothetical protein